MAGVTTRRQAAAAQQEKNATTVNGNAAPVMEQENAPRDILDDLDDDEPAENIFLFYPNLIGYARIILAVASLYYMPIHPRTCTLLYSISCLLDALDGIAARAYNQSTRFGAVLDMGKHLLSIVTKRATRC